MGHSPVQNKKLYGTATVGTKGQVVIPADAREELNITAGDRLYVVGSADSGFLGFLKEEALESMVQHLAQQVESFRALKQEKDKEQ
ncbi:MAG TPA: AbrB/MazE/SpoVT family DNA-binding domain-containing protein [Candidatus Saccharimonadales bacterium]|nr:AbrB/MazE/SpoVT family DNA-binding domain-containing protein [Candidatus Saccharimonadales bacterium]